MQLKWHLKVKAVALNTYGKGVLNLNDLNFSLN